jgi:filamentous hemagglutinin family protein
VVFRLAACGWTALLAGLLPGVAAAQHISIYGGRTLAGPNYQIGANLGHEFSGNLFQSFGIFGLGANESATFTGPARVDNIIAGVSGGNLSSIDGTIKSAIRGANLYFINPNGIVFGPHARVNVSGSFYASTADYLKLGRNGRFDVIHPDGSKLTAAPLAAFGFLDPRPARITVNGARLGRVPGTLGLVGGSTSVTDGALARARAIDVTAVAGTGLVPVDPRRRAALTVRRFGRAAIAGNSVLDATAGKAGLLAVTAGRLSLTGGAELLSFGGSGPGAPILVSAPSIRIDGGAEIASIAQGPENGGSVRVAAQTLRIVGNGQIVSSTKRKGNAGDVTVIARNLELAGFGAIASDTSGEGNGGRVRVDVTGRGRGALTIQTDGRIETQTSGAGNGGWIAVEVRGGLTIDAAGADPSSFTGIVAGDNTGSTGNGGNVRITARSLHLAGSGSVIGTNTSGLGHGGNIGVRARSLRLEGSAAILSLTGGAGNGGRVSVDAPILSVTTEAAIIASNTSNGGNVGSVIIRAGRLTVDRGGQVTATTSTHGAGGNVRLTARSLRLAGSGVIASNTVGIGNGGNVSVDITGEGAGALVIRTNGEIAAGTFAAGHGGQIAVDVQGGLVIDSAGANPAL